MDRPSEKPQVAEIRRQAQAKVAEERAALGTSGDDQILQWAESGESGDAEHFISLFRDRLCFDHAAGLWYGFPPGGHHWQLCEKEEQMDLVGQLIEPYELLAKQFFWRKLAAVKAGDDKAAQVAGNKEQIILKKIAQLRRRRYRQDVLILAAAGPDSLGIRGSEWDSQALFLPFGNGVLDLATGNFRSGFPADYIKTVCPIYWAGFDTPALKWESFFADIMAGDLEKISYLKRLLGSAISGIVVDHLFPILWGKAGRNGKSVLIETLGFVLGPLAGPIQSELLLAQKYPRSAAAPSPEIMALRGKRLVWASESDENRRLNAGKIKWISGGDSLVGRGPYDRREVNFRPTHTLFMLTNFKPIGNPQDAALWERIHLIEFFVSFMDDPQGDSQKLRNPNIGAELREEGPGIMAWLVAGYYEYLEKGLAPPSSVLNSTKEYRRSEDSISQFIKEYCIVGEDRIAWLKDLHEAYISFCDDSGFKPSGKKKFSSVLQDGHLKDRDEKGIFFNGIGLKDVG